jgi:hypothetical protein
LECDVAAPPSKIEIVPIKVSGVVNPSMGLVAS